MTMTPGSPMQFPQEPVTTLPPVAWLPDGHHYTPVAAGAAMSLLGIAHIISPFTIPTTGTLTEVTTLVSESPSYSIQLNASGEFLLPVTGHYVVTVSLQFSVTAAASWIATIACIQNGTTTATHQLSYPSGIAPAISYNTQIFAFVPSASSPVRLGVGVTATTITAGTLPTCEVEINFLGSP